MPRGRVLIGTSGWVYRHWAGFYGAIPPDQRLEHISRVFPTVEINASFYALPTADRFARWAQQTPPGFVFAVKLSRDVTHVRKLVECREPVDRFLAAARHLGSKLGPILVQLPPSVRARPDRLGALLAHLRETGAAMDLAPRVAVEFRHASWIQSADTRDVLRAHRAALVLAHSTRWPRPDSEPLTAPWVYVRFHGTGPGPYGVTRLRPWASKIRQWSAAGRRVYAYFNNDWEGHALRDARTLIRLTGAATNETAGPLSGSGRS
jgi:uncharacterized protein YecE (DUF72 family)